MFFIVGAVLVAKLRTAGAAYEFDASDQRGISISELSRQPGVSKTTVPSPDKPRAVRPGPARCRDAKLPAQRSLLELAAAVSANSDVRQAVQPPRSIVDGDACLEEVAQTRLRGYAFENEECLVGVCAVSASVIYHEGQTIGSMSIVGAKSRVGEQLNEFAEPVMDAAAQTSLRPGAPRGGRWRSNQ